MSFEDRAVGCLLGLAVGDALGTTLEFTKRDSGPPVRDLVGGGPFNLKPGQWTDDTAMALCLAESLLYKRRLDAKDLMTRFSHWYREGHNSCTGTCFDIGNTTRAAIERWESGLGTPKSDPMGAGNGSLMRLAPIAIFYNLKVDLARQQAEAQSYLTHGAREAALFCGRYAMMLIAAIQGIPKDAILSVYGDIGSRSRDQVRSTSYVGDTYEAAIWSVMNSDDFKGAVILAANLCDDADTVAAVTGQFAGALYGKSGIPLEWRKKLAWSRRIEQTAKLLIAA